MIKLAAAIFFSVALVPVAVSAQAKSGKGSGYEQLNLFGEAFERIRQDAVEPVTEAKLVAAAIAGMLSGLDARSAYISEAAFRASQTPANDDDAALGLVLTIENGQLQVISPQDGSPAAHAGMRPGDVIFRIDKEPAYDMTLGEAEQKLRGPTGSEIQLTLRHGTDKPIDLTLKREAYKLRTVVGRVEGENIGYLRIAGFDGTTLAALTASVQDLRQKIGSKLIGLILDLRNNPGGAFEPQSRSRTPSSTRATSSSSRAANRRASSGSAPPRVILLTVCRSSRWSMAALPERPSSSPARCKMIGEPCCSALRPLARARSKV